MNTNQTAKSDKKYFIRFILTFVVITGIGGVCGYFSGRYITPEDFALSERIQEMVAYWTTCIMGGMNFMAAFVCVRRVMTVKKRLKAWDGEDDELPMNMDKQLNMPLVLCNTVFILNIILFAISCRYLIFNDFEGDYELFIMAVLFFFAGLVWAIAVQNAIINLIKKMNPEKQGSVFQGDFAKTWEESCDEYEKLIIYKSSHKAYKCVSTTCLILNVVTLVTMLTFKTGIFACICVGIIWLVATLSYQITAIKLEG